MSLGVIDIGSNTVRLAVYDTTTFKVIENGVNYAGLISYVEAGKISDEGLEILCSVVLEMKAICEKINCDRYYAFATASLRDIEDKESLIKTVADKTGVKMEIISGEKEAECDYLGLKLHYNTDTGAVFDLGGGSAQLITFEDGKVTANVSKKIGALKLYKTFVKDTFPTYLEEVKIREYIKSEISGFKSKEHEFIFAMGGAASAIKKLYRTLFGEKKEDFTVLELKSFLEVPENIINSVIPERLYTIRPALIAIEEICNTLKTDRIKCVTCGVRDGMMYKLMEKRDL